MFALSSFLDKRSVVSRLIIYIVLFSSVVTLLTTSLQLYREYKRDVDVVVGAVENLRISHLDSLTRSLWALDNAQIQLTVDGIARITDIQRVEVVDSYRVMHSAGAPSNNRSRIYRFPLVHVENSRDFVLGELRVTVDLQGIYARLFDRIWLILLSNGLRTFAVSTFVFLIFQRLVTRHLRQIAGYAQQLSPETLDRPLKLARRARVGPPDEIDQLATSVDTMRENLRRSYLALSESEERFRHLAERIDAVFWISSTDWKEVIYVSPAYQKVWGKSCAELYESPRSWLESIHPEDRPGVERIIAEATSDLTSSTTATAGPPRIDFEPYRVTHSDGTLRWISARAFPVSDDRGALRYVVGIAEDITQQVRADEALNEAKEVAERESAAKSQFLAHMSHELRTPLNAILGFSGMLEHEILGPVEPKGYRDYAIDIQESGRHLLSIIDDILDLSRIEAGKATFKPERLAPGKLVDEALRLVKKQAAEKGIGLENSLSADLPMIEADRRAIVQVLTNVITNAIKFTPPGGLVRLDAQRRLKGGIDLHVEDNGRGIAPEEMAELFTPFARKNVFMARVEEGTGLGLAICKQLMQLQGFDITVSSKVGLGTDVTLEFPNAATDRLTEAPPAPRRAAV